jgi:hypothetical protein
VDPASTAPDARSGSTAAKVAQPSLTSFASWLRGELLLELLELDVASGGLAAAGIWARWTSVRKLKEGPVTAPIPEVVDNCASPWPAFPPPLTPVIALRSDGHVDHV